MSKTFVITFNNFTGITVKMGGDVLDYEDDWTDVDTSQTLTVEVDTNDSFSGNRFLLFFGDSSAFANQPSITLKDTNGNTYTGNALAGGEYDQWKYYIKFGEYWDGRAYIGYTDTGIDIYINSDVFDGNTIVNCGGVSENVNFYNNDFGLIGVYEVDKPAILSIMQNNRYKLNTVSDVSESISDIINVLDYIKTLYKTHINIDSTTEETIYINGVAVSATGKPIENYVMDFETENIKIQGYYNNVLDNDCEININIPYYGLYHLDSNYINHNIKLKFICDLMTNNSLCNIYIDDIIIDVLELKTGYEIPLKDLNINETKQRIYSIYDEQCFITLKEKRLSNNIANTILENTTINEQIQNNNLSGFIRCDNIKISNSITNKYEREIIENMLKTGVYI